jgi:hypothetical protein
MHRESKLRTGILHEPASLQQQFPDKFGSIIMGVVHAGTKACRTLEVHTQLSSASRCGSLRMVVLCASSERNHAPSHLVAAG